MYLCIVAVAVGILAGSSAQAGNAIIKTAHASVANKSAQQVAPSTVAVAKPKATKRGGEVQVAVMTASPSQTASKRAVFVRR